MNMTVEMNTDMDMDMDGGRFSGWRQEALTLRVRRDGRTGGRAANGGHLIERLAVQLRLGDIRFEERDEQMLSQIQWGLAVQEGVQEPPKAIEVNVLQRVGEKVISLN